MLSQANFLAGLLGEALAANDAGLAAIAAQRGLEGSITLGLNVGQILGFDVEHWIKCLRTRILVNLGRFAEAEEWLAEVLDIAPGRVDPVVQFVAHAAVVDMAARRGDAATALRHAARVHDYAEQSAIPYLRVVALGCAGLAKAAAADFAGGARELRQAIEHARRAKAGLEFEPRLLADLAETHQRAGQHGVAAEVAGEAIEVARRRTARVAECQASIVRAAALLAAGAGAAAGRHEAEELLGRAERLLRASGAGILEPLLAHARARLGGAVEESRCAR
jgi:adenylate cyclase